MNELIEKISARDLLNSLIPGGALVYFMGLLSSPTYSADFLSDDNKADRQTVNGVNLYYIGSFKTWE